jgi:hypothetical protein
MKDELSRAPVATANAAIAVPNGPMAVNGIRLRTTKSSVEEGFWRPGAFPVRARCLEMDQHSIEGHYAHVLVLSIITIDADRMVVGGGPRRLRSRLGELGLRPSKHMVDRPPADPQLCHALRESEEGTA